MELEKEALYINALRVNLDKKGYILGDLLGKGAFAGCFKVIRKVGHFTFACKVIHSRSDSKSEISALRESYENEMNTLKSILHPNIISVFDFFTIGSMYMIILEYCPNGTIEDLMRKQPQNKLTKMDLLRYSTELVDAVAFLHMHNIAHHDIKPSNCLIDKYQRLKLSDFGLSKQYQNPESEIRRGTILFIAPEIYTSTQYDPFKSDIYAIGVTLYLMLTGRVPFKERKNIAKLREEQNQFIFRASNHKDKLEAFLVRIINLCMCVDPVHRPPITKIQNEFKKFKNSMHVDVPRITSLPEFGRAPSPPQNADFSPLASPTQILKSSPLCSSMEDVPKVSNREGKMPLAMRSPLKAVPRMSHQRRRALSVYRSGALLTFADFSDGQIDLTRSDRVH